MSDKQFDIADYIVKQPVQATPDELESLDKRLEELRDEYFAFEKEAFKDLRLQRIARTYPEINPEFLRLHREGNFKGKDGRTYTIQVPRFAVWNVKDPSFYLTISRRTDLESVWIRKCMVVNVTNEIPHVLARQLALSTEVLCDLDGSELQLDYGGYTRKCGQLPTEIVEKYKRLGNVTLQAVYQGLLSSDARTAVKEAQMLFLKKVYFAREIEPQQWNAQPSAQDKDPIMLGLIYDKCFLIKPHEKKAEDRGQDEPAV